MTVTSRPSVKSFLGGRHRLAIGRRLVFGVARKPVKSSCEGPRLDLRAIYTVKSSCEGLRLDFGADTTYVSTKDLIASRPTRSSKEGSQLGLSCHPTGKIPLRGTPVVGLLM